MFDLATVTYITLFLSALILTIIVYLDYQQRKKDTHLLHVYKKRPNISKKIYVAGAWIHRGDIHTKMEELQENDFIVTSKWPSRENTLNNPDAYKECSRLDIEELVNADTVLVFMTDPTYAYRGTFTEIGCAIGSGRRIIIICDGTCIIPEKSSPSESNIYHNMQHIHQNMTFSHSCMQNIFFWDPLIEHVSSFEDAIKLLNGKKIQSPFKKLYTNILTTDIKHQTENNNDRCDDIDQIQIQPSDILMDDNEDNNKSSYID